MKPALLLLALAAVACGSHDKSKDAPAPSAERATFALTLDAGAEAQRATLERLVKAYDARLGFDGLTLAPAGAAPGSRIVLSETLRATTSAVGEGRWLKDAAGRYQMELELDAPFVRANAAAAGDDASALFKVFAHAVGHGLGLRHTTDNPRDVMAPDVSGDKDLAAYFAQAQAIFAHGGHAD